MLSISLYNSYQHVGRAANGMVDILADQGVDSFQIYVQKLGSVFLCCVALYVVSLWYNPFIPLLLASLVVGCCLVLLSFQ